MAATSEKPETALLSADAHSRLPQHVQIALQQVDNLKYFLVSAPVDWAQDQYIRRFLLPTGEYVSCVLWNTLFHISGTDIVRCLAFRFHAFGRPVKNHKKFEEGIFSDLRNLKAGTDASLEDPKSPFLDFLYKNNCIRTQKKQKVFYWYSVPHDRLFLDALERDLKREKAGQEATTAAESEPALSFEFDASQSLYDQLSKIQAGSVFAAFASQHTANPPGSMSHTSVSPSSRAADSMPPPPTSSTQSQQMVSHAAQYMSQESLNDVSSYSPMTMPAPSAIQSMIPAKREHYYDQVITAPYDRNSFNQLAHMHHRQSSVPSYIECSPAPSFVSAQSHYDEYSARGFSYPPEPTTPPQQSVDCTPEPSFLTPDDLYSSTMLDNKQNTIFGNTSAAQYTQYGMGPPQYTPMNCGQIGSAMYSHLDGSPNYKQKRRRTSVSQMPQSLMMMANFPHKSTDPYNAKRPTDLRRAVSASYVPPNVNGSFDRDVSAGPVATPTQSMTSFMQTSDLSRHGSPMASIENMDFNGRNDRASSISDMYNFTGQVAQYPVGAVRRARSATMTEAGAYSAKTHSCPIPGCGRVFKRLEHLKRHVKTHTQERPHVCPECNKAFSRSDNLAQHRRTHENDTDSFAANTSFSGQEVYEIDDELAALTEVGPDMSCTSFSQPSTSVQMTNHSRPGSMGPPPLPISAQGY